jgi:2',3'-cyclic-nucleotide 2'-phosphodiesterase (5'-nucleotidase family)
LTLDAGDWSEGTAYYKVDNGVHMLKILDLMKFDATVVGNHDYLAGPDVLLDVVKSAQPSFPVLAANVDVSNFKRSAEFKKLIPPHAILNRSGIRIGVVGLTTTAIEYKDFIKPGGIQLHDCGIVYAPERPYVLCIMAQGKTTGAILELMRTISAKTYATMLHG